MKDVILRRASALSLILLPAAVSAQEWVAVSTSVDAFRSTSTYDVFRGRVVLGASTGRAHEHDGSRWLPLPGLPESYYAPRLAYQVHRGRTLALTNPMNGSQLQTWEHDGAVWRQRTPDHLPTWRFNHQMAYDASRQRVVMFGGTRQARLDDTWEWDGSDWERQFPAVVPAARDHQGMSFDPVRNVVIMFGGRDDFDFLDDHWEWDGAAWTQRQLAVRPTPRSRGKLAYDAVRNLTVLYGGFFAQNGIVIWDPQPWEFDGQQWVGRTIPSAPTPRAEHTMVDVPGGVRIFGGTNSAVTGGDEQRPQIIDYDGTAFLARNGPIVSNHSASYDEVRGRTVVVGWTPFFAPPAPLRTFEWDGSALSEVSVAGPSPRTFMATSDDLNGTIYGFGGTAHGGGLLGDTWGYDGVQWQQVATTGPSPRTGATMATDRGRGVVVLFGGEAINFAFADTWEWDGVTWTQRAVSGPSARAYASMAYDPVGGRCVMHAGSDVNSHQLFDTWEYDGTAWSQVPGVIPGVPPGSIAWSPELSSLLVTYHDGLNPPSVTYALSGSFWYQLSGAQIEERILGTATDPNGHVVAFKTADGLAASVFTTTPGTVQDVGGACSNFSPEARLVLRDRPRPGNLLRVELIGAQAGQVALFAGSHGLQGGVFGGCGTYLAQPVALGIGTTNPVGQAVLPLGVPNVPSLIGVGIGVQVAAGEIGGPIGGALGLTAAKWIVLGD